MIPRYSRPEMTQIWEPENRYRIWFDIEAHATDAMAELGVVPKAAAAKIRKRARWDVARIDEIERETKHDVIAFLTNVAEHVGEPARFLHQGMTSSDVLDTCLAVQLTQAAALLLKDLDGLLAALKRRALEHKMTPCIGRSHGIHAEPTTFGLKLAGHYAAFARGRERLARARDDVATCAISGAVGTFANIDPRVEEYVGGEAGFDAGAGLHPDHPARPPCPVLRHARRHRRLDRESGDRGPPSAAQRAARGRGILLARSEGLFGDAAQAQSRAVGESDRPVPADPFHRDAGAGEHRAVA